MIAKLRPNVLLIALMVTGLMAFGLWATLAHVSGNTELTQDLMLVLLGYTVGSGSTGLLALAMRVAQDPPPPSYPAKELPDLVRALREPVGKDD